MKLFPVVLFLALQFPPSVLAEVKCLDSVGEAVIVNNDLPSAKIEAIARAKWAAIEQAVGVEVRAQSIVQNMQMVDEAIIKKNNGVVSQYKIIQITNGKDDVTVKINACVEPVKAKDAVAGLALNNSIALFLPARKLRAVNEKEEIRYTRYGKNARHALAAEDEYEEANILSETLTGKLAGQGYTVLDVAPANAADASEVEKAMKSGNFMPLRSLMYKSLSNVMLTGKVDYTISARKGENIGYGISMPFNSVAARLTYRLVSRDSTGKMVVLAAGAEQGKGMASNVEDAAAKGLKDLSEKLSPVILEKLGEFIKSSAKVIEIKVSGINELSDNFAVRELLQNIAWVTAVKDKGLGEFTVNYPENTIYLANSLAQKRIFQIEKFTPYAIHLKYFK